MPSPARISAALAAELFDRSQAARWDLSADRFRASLDAAVAHALGGDPPAADVEKLARALHVEDLALACACAHGLEAAWDHFVVEHRAALYRAADAIDPSGRAREVADSLYADLFGLQERDGVRQSLFRYFHGRSRLSTWLRAVLSQRWVDRVRSTRRLDPLPEDETDLPARRVAAPDPERPRHVAALRQALEAAVAALEPRDRLRLRCYYVQDMTLAAVGRLLHEHEATVSRHLSRTRRDIRSDVESSLRRDHGFDDAGIAACFEAIVDDPGSLDLAALVAAPDERKGGSHNRSRS